MLRLRAKSLLAVRIGYGLHTVMFVTLSMKKRSERRKHCALAVVRRKQKFSHHRRPPSRGAGPPKFNQLKMVTTDPAWWISMHAISSYRGNRPTHKQTHKPTHIHRQDRLQYTAPLSLARSVTICVYMYVSVLMCFRDPIIYYIYLYVYFPCVYFVCELHNKYLI